MRSILTAAAWTALCIGSPLAHAAAPPVTDCPLARERYSINSPLIDLTIDPRARKLIDDSGVIANAPAVLRRHAVPGFPAILSLSTMKTLLGVSPDTLDRLDRQLQALPIRPQDVVARCARYERSIATPLRVQRGRPAVLVFEKSNGFRDGPSVDAATTALRRIGERRGWQMIFSSRSGDFTPANLRQFDAVIWNNVSGDALTLPQRRAFRDYVERGGGFAGFHGSGGDPVYWWDWYADTLIGARFNGHPSEHQNAMLKVEGQSAITRGIAPGWSLKEEWYSFKKSPRGAGTRVLVTVDERSYDPIDGKRDIRMGDHPIAWTRCVRNGRSFYSAIGHRPEVYADPSNELLMEQGIAWAMGRSDTKCRAGREVAARRN